MFWQETKRNSRSVPSSKPQSGESHREDLAYRSWNALDQSHIITPRHFESFLFVDATSGGLYPVVGFLSDFTTTHTYIHAYTQPYTHLSYQSLAQAPPVLVNFNMDSGKRSCQIVSSPRIAPDVSAKLQAVEAEPQLRFERIMRWDDLPGDSNNEKERKTQNTASEQPLGGREEKLKPKNARPDTPSWSFMVTERERDHATVRKLLSLWPMRIVCCFKSSDHCILPP
jgi:hypothetical protein